MIHSGSRGLGHQVATDALVAMEKAMKRDGIQVRRTHLMLLYTCTVAKAIMEWLQDA